MKHNNIELLSIDEFKYKVREMIQEIDSSGLINSACPECYGSLGIMNSHKCQPGWEFYYQYPTVEYVVEKMRKHRAHFDMFKSVTNE